MVRVVVGSAVVVVDEVVVGTVVVVLIVVVGTVVLVVVVGTDVVLVVVVGTAVVVVDTVVVGAVVKVVVVAKKKTYNSYFIHIIDAVAPIAYHRGGCSLERHTFRCRILRFLGKSARKNDSVLSTN